MKKAWAHGKSVDETGDGQNNRIVLEKSYQQGRPISKKILENK